SALELSRAEGIRTWNVVPSAVRGEEDVQEMDGGEIVNLAGEPLTRQTVERLYGKGGREVYNLYGPTEATTDSSGGWGRPSEDQEPSIGRPLGNTRVYVLDEAQELAPIGVAGELYIGGEGVARGYLKRPGLTAERFVPDGYGGEEGGRLCRTGDRVRWREDGE